jgi:transglutaminase-like putative cysteine protease
MPYGRYGIPGTVDEMSRLARGPRGEQHLGLIRLVREQTRGVRAKDYASEVAAIYHWVCRHYRYVRDPVHVELVMDPVAFYEAGMQGDCDDCACYLAAAVQTIGCPARFVTAGFRKTTQPEFTHVFCEAYVSRANQWLTVDPVAGPMTAAMRRQMVWRRNYPLDPDMGRVETVKVAA